MSTIQQEAAAEWAAKRREEEAADRERTARSRQREADLLAASVEGILGRAVDVEPAEQPVVEIDGLEFLNRVARQPGYVSRQLVLRRPCPRCGESRTAEVYGIAQLGELLEQDPLPDPAHDETCGRPWCDDCEAHHAPDEHLSREWEPGTPARPLQGNPYAEWAESALGNLEDGVGSAERVSVIAVSYSLLALAWEARSAALAAASSVV